MASVVVMPQLGNSVESCIITAWEVAVGDSVDVGGTLCQIETDKAAMEVPSTAAGTVLELLWSAGDDVPVKEPILVLGDPGEVVDHRDPGLVGSDAVHQMSPTALPEVTAPVTGSNQRQAASSATRSSPRARKLALDKGMDIEMIPGGSGPQQRVIERDVVAALRDRPSGTGIGGRMTKTDREIVARDDSSCSADELTPAADDLGVFTEMPLRGVRRIVAERMMNSLATSAQLTYTATADATGLLALRARLKSSPAALGLTGVTIGDLVCFAVVMTLPRHPAHNAHLVDGVLRTFEQVHLGFACDTPRGLLVPTIRSASAMTLRELSDTSKRLAAEAADGRISPDLLGGATFTVSNLGSFGIENFTPLINVPQTAILGVNAIFPRAVITADGSTTVQQRIGLSLTADHQVIDGADAARFLKDLVIAVENIDITALG